MKLKKYESLKEQYPEYVSLDQLYRIVNRFKGYMLEDCACEYCLHYAGRKKPCPLEVCCCAEEKRQAAGREGIGAQHTAVRLCRM